MGLLYTVPNRSVRISTLARVAKPARAQLDVLESFAVGAEGRVVVHSARHVRPVDRYDLAVRCFLKIHDAESLFRIGDDLGDLRRPLRKMRGFRQVRRRRDSRLEIQGRPGG